MKKLNKIIIFFLILINFSLIFYFFPKQFVIFLAYFLTFLFIGWGIFHLFLLIIGIKKPFDKFIQPTYYPKFSIIIPAKNEPILMRTVESFLHHTDYPIDKKEIIIVTEDEIGERIGLFFSQKYPKNVKCIVRKNFFPTKPSALNDVLTLCSGEIITIADAEDIPDKDVLLKIASVLQNTKYECAQVILRITNHKDSWISKMFALEYAGWFRILLNARSKLGLFTPLGGSGNYFKKDVLNYVGKYDSLNLTEDAELTVRLLIKGDKILLVNSRHWEEGPVTFKAWLRQRTRWFRGWLQTLWKYLFVLVKYPYIKRIGLKGVISTFLMLFAPIIVILNWVAYSLTLIWIFEYLNLLPTNLLSGTFPFYSIIPLLFNLIYFLILIEGGIVEGIIKEQKLKYLKYIPTIFIYINILMPIASLRAIYQQIFKDVFWEKTAHFGRGVKWHSVDTINYFKK